MHEKVMMVTNNYENSNKYKTGATKIQTACKAHYFFNIYFKFNLLKDQRKC